MPRARNSHNLLLSQSDSDYVNSSINYFSFNKPNSSEHSSVIKIEIDSVLFINNDIGNRGKEKWFINLSSLPISINVQDLLSLCERFSLPSHYQKRLATFEFIKNVENNIKKYNDESKFFKIADGFFS